MNTILGFLLIGCVAGMASMIPIRAEIKKKKYVPREVVSYHFDTNQRFFFTLFIAAIGILFGVQIILVIAVFYIGVLIGKRAIRDWILEQ